MARVKLTFSLQYSLIEVSNLDLNQSKVQNWLTSTNKMYIQLALIDSKLIYS